MIQYYLPNNTIFLVIINKFDPNPILININKLKPYWFQYTTTFKGLESIIKKGRDTTNTKIRINTIILENAHGTSTKFSFLVDGIEIQESQLGTKKQDLVVGTKIQESWLGTKNQDLVIGIEIQESWLGTKNQNSVVGIEI